MVVDDNDDARPSKLRNVPDHVLLLWRSAWKGVRLCVWRMEMFHMFKALLNKK